MYYIENLYTFPSFVTKFPLLLLPFQTDDNLAVSEDLTSN